MANPAFYSALKIEPGQLADKPVQELFSGEKHQPELRDAFASVLEHGFQMQDVEVEYTIPPKTQRVFTITARRAIIGEDLDEMVLVEIRDVTRAKNAERVIQELNEALMRHGVDLEAMNEELEAFSHSVSHDLRTPLRLTNKIAHLLLQEHGPDLPAGAADKVYMILDSTHEMGKLIEDLLTFSQVGREPLRKRRVDVRRLVRESLEELEDERKGRDVEVVIDELPSCQADRALLKRVYVNLLANSLKFTRTRTRALIHVGFAQSEEDVAYFIRDNGVGFDMAQSEDIFLPFHRLHKTHDFEGSGVGLALVKRIVERHNGRVWAEGQTDRGATLYFSLGE